MTHGGEDVELVWRTPYVRYEPQPHVAHAHRTEPARLARPPRLLRPDRRGDQPAPSRPGPPAARLPVDDRRLGRLVARRPVAALALTATATALLARETRPERATAAELAGLGTLRSGRVVADALTRHWWPLSPSRPSIRARLPLAISSRPSPLKLVDDLAYGTGLWLGCIHTARSTHFCPRHPGSSSAAHSVRLRRR